MNDDPQQAPREPQELPTADAIAVAAPVPRVPGGLRNSWRKWLNVTARPSVASFARELPTANWHDILPSLLGLGLLSAIIQVIAGYSAAQILGFSQWDGSLAGPAVPSWVAGAAFMVIQPLEFLLPVGLVYMVGRVLDGRGSYLDQTYAMALFYVPVQGVITIAALVPTVGQVAVIVLMLYELVLIILALAESQYFKISTSVVVVVVSLLIPGVVAVLVFDIVVTSARNTGPR
ncbi:MAG TPA: hypothetical protein VGP82_00215 [Ktedonobacterales bacterium]|nr:hypothetical protein [Ktedonobacterales bacterium]